jgi:hypothetical protein
MTSRDVLLMTNLARLRLASSAQLAALDGGSKQNVERALLGLWENGYLERPLAQAVGRKLENGSRPLVYGLGRKGAAFLRQQGFDVRRRLLDGIDKERSAGWRFIEHSVAISEFLVGLELGARKRSDVRVLERGEILEDAPKSKRDRAVKLEARIRIGGSERRSAVVPDALFGLRFGDDTESYFMLEIDRGEMPVERYRNTQQTYFAKKMATYHEANRQKVHVHALGIPNFRVLTLTTDQQRIERMLEALDAITEGRGSNMFLFGEQDSLSKHGPLDLEWTSGKRGTVRLMD